MNDEIRHWGMGDWAGQISEILEDERRLGRRYLSDDERERLLATLELFGKGIDPKHPRRFRGLVLLTIQCIPQRHVLGLVYATSHGPLFVAAILMGAGRAVRSDGSIIVGKRDPWVFGAHAAAGDQSESFMVPQPIDRLWPRGMPDSTPLRCRCGTRRVPPGAVNDALDAGKQILTV